MLIPTAGCADDLGTVGRAICQHKSGQCDEWASRSVPSASPGLQERPVTQAAPYSNLCSAEDLLALEANSDSVTCRRPGRRLRRPGANSIDVT
jgi:hypothetical protein